MARERKTVRGREAAALLRQNAIPFLERLSEHREPVSPTEVIREIGSDPKNAVALAKRLAKKGFLQMEETGLVAGRPTYSVRITERGLRLLRLLKPAIDFIESTPGDRRRSDAQKDHQ